MQLQDMNNGTRVQIVRQIELYPDGSFEPGLTGTVESVGGDGEAEPYCLVKLDQLFPDLARLDNRLQVWQDHILICVAADFEPAEGACSHDHAC